MKLVSPLVVVSLALASSASAAELLVNGDFEAGTFASWTAFTQAGSNGQIFPNNIAAGGVLPNSGGLSSGSSAGLWCASVDQGGPGAYTLSQNFTVSPAAVSVFISFDMFHRDSSGAAPVNSGVLDYTVATTQWARVDILDSVGAVLATYSDIGSQPWTNYSADITALVTPGQTYTFRYAHVDNQNFYHTGLDNASVREIIPAPGAAALLGLAGLAVARRRR